MSRELLEKAAMAAGIAARWSEPFECLLIEAEPYEGEPTWREWKPLTDDGDAFRLLVALRMDVVVDGKNAYATAYQGRSALVEQINNDPYAATRLAIVRAAAMGEKP